MSVEEMRRTSSLTSWLKAARPGASLRSSPSLSGSLTIAFLRHPFQILAAPGVYLYAVALVHEEGHVDRDAGLEGGGLGSTGSGVAPHARLAAGDLEHDGGRQINVNELVVVHEHVDRVAFADIVDRA